MWRTLGQESTVERLSRSVAEGTPHHAYLFLGPAHVGKRTLAIDFACALNCESGEAPCGTCRACRRILEEKHADVYAITLSASAGTEGAESEEEVGRRHARILTEQIEDLQHAATLPPYEGRRKVLLIENADRMTVEAANRLLKMLEEPPPHVVWMLLAESEGHLLETVVSRCQKIDVRPLPTPELERHLIDVKQVSEERARLIARVSRGRTGWALQALEDESFLSGRAAQVEGVIQLISMTFGARFDLSREMDTLYRRDPVAALEALDQWTTWWRDLLLVKTGCADTIVNVDYVNDLNGQAQKLTLEQIRDYIVKLTEARQDLDLNVLPRLVFDSLVYTMPRIARPAGEPAASRSVLPVVDDTQ